MKKILFLLLVSLFLSSCGKKTAQNTITPTPVPRLFEMPQSERPYVSLVPRDDGHMIYLKLSNIPDYVSQIEYELLYSATDEGNEIEKGVGDTIKDIKKTIERALLLGTESCTSGCKYKYDEGVYGGVLTLNFITKDGQIATFETPFALQSSAQLKKAGSMTLPTVDFKVVSAPSDKNFYILLKNYGINGYSIFSANPSSVKYSSYTPDTLTKSDQILTGDYLIP